MAKNKKDGRKTAPAETPKLTNKDYLQELHRLHIELVKLQPGQPSPLDWLAAMPRAWAVRSADRPSSRAHPAAAPKTPALEAGFVAAGVDVSLIGPLPTPGIAFSCCSASDMISGPEGQPGEVSVIFTCAAPSSETSTS